MAVTNKGYIIDDRNYIITYRGPTMAHRAYIIVHGGYITAPAVFQNKWPGPRAAGHLSWSCYLVSPEPLWGRPAHP